MYFNISIDADTYATDYPLAKSNIEKMVVSSYDIGLRRLINYFEKNKIKVTLFVVSSHIKIPFVRDYLKALVDNGHEIATHSFSHYRNFAQLDTDTLNEEIKKSKVSLEDSLGIEIKGFRAPGYTITKNVLESLIKNGFSYDASLNNSVFYYVFKNIYKLFSSKSHFFAVQNLRGFPISSEPFEVNRRYFNDKQLQEFWEIPFDYSKFIFFPLSIFMLNQLPNWIARNIVRTVVESPKEMMQIQFHDYDLVDFKDTREFCQDIYFIKKYIRKSIKDRQILYDKITLDLFNYRTPVLLKDYVQIKSKQLNHCP